MRGAPLRIEPHEGKISKDKATARVEAWLTDANFIKRLQAGGAAEVEQMTILHRAMTERQVGSDGGGGKSGGGGWTDAVIKLIPGEVVAAYLAGKSLLPLNDKSLWVIFTGGCLIVVFLFRLWATKDKKAKVPPEWSAAIISTVSFGVWVYSLGDVFKMFGYWTPENSTLVLTAWTLACPVLLLGLKRILAIP
jgi:hypothetical protein